MKLQIWINSLFFFTIIIKVNSSADEGPKANLTALQEKVEKLIETVLVAIQQYYHQSEKEFKCLPERYTIELMNAVKEGIDCVERNHKEFLEGHIDLLEHRKEFRKCFATAKTTVEYLLQNSDPADNKCPSEMMEKTFQINVTTSYTKTFNLNIQNGVEVLYDKTIQVTRLEEPCRNYPDVFSFDEKPGGHQMVTSGILHHNPAGGNGYRRSGTQDRVTDELTIPRNLSPSIEHSKQERKGEIAYAYFQSFHNAQDKRDREEQPGKPEIVRNVRNPPPSVSKDRQPEVTV